MQVIELSQGGGRRSGFPLFSLGFRPFFLLAGIAAVALLVVWGLLYSGGMRADAYYGPVGWHIHEMLFGYTVAVIAGFLLTAVRNWTNRPTLNGTPLALLAALWVAGRMVPFGGSHLPGAVIAATDLAFLVLLIPAVGVPLLRSRQKHNYIFIALLLGLALGNLMVHLQALGVTGGTARTGIYAGLTLVVLLMLIMGGRVIPFFTERGVGGAPVKRWRWVEWLSLGTVPALVLVEAPGVPAALVPALAGVAAAANAVRLAGWYRRRVWSQPLLWVLHLGYAWMVAGFALLALGAVLGQPPAMSVHAFTAGGIGVLTLGMMARVALGHSGRRLHASVPLAAAFVAVNLAAFVRVFLTGALPGWYHELMFVSIGFWVLAFGIFTLVYAPILLRPSLEGAPPRR